MNETIICCTVLTDKGVTDLTDIYNRSIFKL